MTATHWACLAGHTGTYDAAAITTKTDASLPDARHLATCGGALTTGLDAASVGRVVERMRAGVAGS